MPQKPTLRLSESSVAANGAAITLYIEECAGITAEVVRHRGWASKVRAVSSGEPFAYESSMSERELAFMSTVVMVDAIHRIWAKRKIVHRIHPHMADVLINSVADQMPGSLFAKQPYSDPLIVFPVPLEVATLYGTPGRLVGFHVVGQRPNGPHRALCSTHDAARSDLLLNFLIQVEEPEQELLSVRARVPAGQETFTVEDVVNRSLANFVAEGSLLASPERAQDALRTLVSAAMGILVYTCTKQPDMVAVPSRGTRGKARRKRGDTMPEKPIRNVNLGWVLGPALDAARHVSQRRAATASSSTGRRQRPHQRRAHMRLFWVGPGRKEPEMKFIAPYEVSLDLLRQGGVRAAQIHPVGDEK
jgi:hypothetical protein